MAMLASMAIDLNAESVRASKTEGLPNSINFPWLRTAITSESKMVFKRCAIMGQDFNHNSFSHKSTGRSVIPVNTRLAEHLNNLDIQVLVEGTESNLSPMCANMREFFLLLAVCNTVIVA